jgi:hypothetical protein
MKILGLVLGVVCSLSVNLAVEAETLSVNKNWVLERDTDFVSEKVDCRVRSKYIYTPNSLDSAFYGLNEMMGKKSAYFSFGWQKGESYYLFIKQSKDWSFRSASIRFGDGEVFQLDGQSEYYIPLGDSVKGLANVGKIRFQGYTHSSVVKEEIDLSEVLPLLSRVYQCEIGN